MLLRTTWTILTLLLATSANSLRENRLSGPTCEIEPHNEKGSRNSGSLITGLPTLTAIHHSQTTTRPSASQIHSTRGTTQSAQCHPAAQSGPAESATRTAS